jgi:hypothetical protein
MPPPYELPAALLLVLGGAIACFAGFRLFRIVLAIYGFIFGAMLASSVVAPGNTAGMVVAAVAGGLVGAAILVFAYFIGIALVGAGLGALVAHLGASALGSAEPPAVVLILLAIAGAVGAMLLQRYVIVVATAFGGAWTLILGALSIAAARAGGRPTATSVADVWILYPTTPPAGQRWLVVAAWMVLGLIGTAVQLGVTGRKR